MLNSTSQEQSPELEELTEYLKSEFDYDISIYKPSVLLRQLKMRMEMLHLESIDSYRRYLVQRDHAEYRILFHLLHPCVTKFMRDPLQWDCIAKEIIPTLLARKTEKLRVWSVGCASGQEPFTIAMLFAEAVGLPNLANRVVIFATDTEEQSLKVAGTAIYSERELEEVSPQLRAKYFQDLGAGRFSVIPELRRAVRFLHHDFVHEKALRNVDLICCRNVLMYLRQEIQNSLLLTLANSLSDCGYLLLGASETTGDCPVLERINHEQIFRRATSLDSPTWRADKFVLTKRAFDVIPCPQLVFHRNGVLVSVNHAARRLLSVRATECGKHVSELPFAKWLPELADQMTAHNIAQSEFVIRSGTQADGTELANDLKVSVIPILQTATTTRGFVVTMHEITTT